VTSDAPADIWREGCWRYVVYPGQAEDRGVELIFAVYLRSRRPQIRAAMLDALTNEVLTGPQAGPIPDPVGPAWPGGGGWPEPPVAEPAEPAAPAHPAGLGRLFPERTPARPLVAAAARVTENAFAAGGPAGPRALHLAAPVYGPDDTAPLYPAHRGGPGQRAEHGHPAGKPEVPMRPAPRRARHRSSAAL
jgi:hypothetical protein